MKRLSFKYIAGALILLGALLQACSGANGADGRDAEEVNVDSLATAIRSEVTESLWDTLYAKPYVDTVYKILFDNAFGTAWMDSTRQALVDSLKQADYDSLYAALYDSVYYDIYSQSIIKQLDAYKWTVKEGINLAFANQYPLMYKDYVNSSGDIYPVPVSVIVRNECPSAISIFDTEPCSWKKIMVKAWITDWTDTGSVSGIVNPDTTDVFAPPLTFDMTKAVKLTAPEKVNIQIRAYALENDHEILFYSASEPTTLYPVQVNGSELQGVKNRNWWFAAWVTPNMDSIPNILNDLKMIMNQQYDSVNCFTLILCGEPSLNHILSRQPHEALRQRIVVHYDFQGLSDEEAVQYVLHKLSVAGSSKAIIEDAALLAVAGQAHGNPRIIDNIMTDALIIGTQAGKNCIDTDVVMSAVGNQNLG